MILTTRTHNKRHLDGIPHLISSQGNHRIRSGRSKYLQRRNSTSGRSKHLQRRNSTSGHSKHLHRRNSISSHHSFSQILDSSALRQHSHHKGHQSLHYLISRLGEHTTSSTRLRRSTS